MKNEQIKKLNICPMYQAVRDKSFYRKEKKLLENIFRKNHEFIGDSLKQFKNQLVENFEDTIWHLCLIDCLPKFGFELLKPPKIGPDIKATKGGKIYWIEAVNSNLGESVQNPVAKDGVSVELGIPNDPRVVTRLAGVFRDKSKKIKKYLDHPIESDPVLSSHIKVIAVSSHTNMRARRDKFMEKVLFENIEVQKESGAIVNLGFLMMEEHQHIDQVIYTSYDPLAYLEKLERYIEWYGRDSYWKIKG